MGRTKVDSSRSRKLVGEVEFEGLNGGTWVSVTERSRGFVVSVGFDMEELDWLMEHLKKAVELEASGVLKAILSVQEYPERVGGASKEKNGDIRMNRDTFKGGRSYAEAVAEAGFRTGGCFFVSSTRRVERVHDQGRLSVKGRTILLRKWSPKEIWWFTENQEGLGNEGGKGNFEAGGLDEGKAVGGDAFKCRVTSIA
ncbi:hypothetical protein CK203_101904 [Vitis vinifera]|uniref:DUF4283 domain-containing protein n=1 Tax=Vitis vinifera TaxID=29760 RepID=A0A438DI93_VITVI|nr:hypothetical protein CK203_101904 [Vitis vinifera]